MSQIDKRIKVNTIIENQLPEFLVTDFPKATEFLKQYFISQEFQGGATDLISNFDQYLKSDNLVPEVVFGEISLSEDISETDTTIEVPNSKGFPSEYGLLKIDNEIVTFKSSLSAPGSELAWILAMQHQQLHSCVSVVEYLQLYVLFVQMHALP